MQKSGEVEEKSKIKHCQIVWDFEIHHIDHFYHLHFAAAAASNIPPSTAKINHFWNEIKRFLVLFI